MPHDPVLADLARLDAADREYEVARSAAFIAMQDPLIAEKIVDLFAHYVADPLAIPGPAVLQSFREILDLINKEIAADAASNTLP